ncbi:Ubiquinone biosynthesis O-methyltransferase [Candidatus Hartigia pinicola]|nr:Ubiquinone biosynthesis O-methyltransferase [Candidatus Hartigia pinicola]
MNNAPRPDYQNFDKQEIEKFETVALRWWDLESKFSLLHRINPLRLSYIMQRVDGLFSKKILDVGCGGGILSESMSREGAIVTGIDMGENLLTMARLRTLQSGIPVNYIQETVEEHADKYSHTYDVITCMEMLEHVPSPQSVVHSCAKLVKPGGNVIFSTINRNMKAWLMAVISAEYIMKIVPKGTHNAKKFIRPSELIGWMDNTVLKEQHIIGLHYSLVKDMFYFSPNVDINYILHACRE